MNAAEVGSRIAELRKSKGWTQKQLAERLNVTDKAVSRWERGLNFPDLTTVEPLSALLEVSPSVLLGLAEKDSDEALAVGAAIYRQDRAKWLRELKLRTWIDFVFSLVLFAAELWISWYFDQLGQYGLPQSLSGGMCGLIGTMIGSALWTLRTISKQLKQLRKGSEIRP